MALCFSWPFFFSSRYKLLSKSVADRNNHAAAVFQLIDRAPAEPVLRRAGHDDGIERRTSPASPCNRRRFSDAHFCSRDVAMSLRHFSPAARRSRWSKPLPRARPESPPDNLNRSRSPKRGHSVAVAIASVMNATMYGCEMVWS